MDVFGISDIGRKRESNQDNFFYLKAKTNSCFALVCDGMGGQNGGSVASKMVKDLFCKRITKDIINQLSDDEIKKLIFNCYEEANFKIFEKSFDVDELKGMGTTCITVFVNEDKLMIFNVGDSRVYVKSDEILKQLTVDHSYVQTLVDCGEITKEEARVHPRKNEITKAVGISQNINIDFTNINVNKDDVVLMCTDGLTNYCSDDQIKKIINKNENISLCVQNLIKIANSNGGYDNITAVLIKV